jgi:hypothetical protein
LRRHIHCGFAVLLLVLATALVAQAGTKNYTFTNDTGQFANDLHIEFNQAVTQNPDPPSPFNTSSGSGTATVDFSGGNVAINGHVQCQFTTTGSGPTIKRGWWTHNGTNIGNLDTDNTSPWP